MAITIKFSIHPPRGWFKRNKWEYEKVRKLLENLSLDMGYSCETISSYFILQFCPEGFLWMIWKKDRLTGECQTHGAGPGFHGAVIDFLEFFADESGFMVYVEDETGYYEDRDFQKLKSRYFHKWFRTLLQETSALKDKNEIALMCWPVGYYLPEYEKGYVVSHIRSFSFEEISGMMNSGLYQAFSKEFFVWNEERKDAYYYRNCAMVLLNQECFFMPSSRSIQDDTVNQKIIRMLEKSLEMDPDIPFPELEYLEVCSLASHKPVDTSKCRVLNLERKTGCRKGLVYRRIGAVCFAVPGNYLMEAKFQGKVEHYYDGKEYGGHDYYICSFEKENPVGKWESGFASGREGDLIHLEIEKAEAAALPSVPEDGAKGSYGITARIIYENQITMISIRYSRKEEQSWALELINKVQIVER